VAPEQGRLAVRARTDDDRLAVEGAGEREDARHRANRSVETELTDEANAVGRGRGNVAVGDQEPDGDGEVEARAHLA
jgi:hypothetical protein